jgi:hypothetical protein
MSTNYYLINKEDKKIKNKLDVLRVFKKLTYK